MKEWNTICMYAEHDFFRFVHGLFIWWLSVGPHEFGLGLYKAGFIRFVSSFQFLLVYA